MNKQLGLLLLLTCLAVGGGVWLSYNTQAPRAVAENLFSPGIKQAGKITEITLQNSQKILLQASLVDDKWTVQLPELFGHYPLDKSKLAGFLQKIVQAKLAEAKTTKQSNYHHLGVESIDNIDSLATLVLLNMGSTAKPWQVLVGIKANLGEGSYVRLPTSSQSYLIDQVIELPNDEFEWLQRPLLPVKTSDIESISRSDSKAWKISKSVDDEAFSLDVLPKDRELRYPGIISAYVDSLIGLDFEQLLPLDAERWQKAKVIAKINVLIEQNQALQLKIASVDNDYYVQFSSPTLDKYYLDWTYKISAFSAQQLLKSKDDFLSELSDTGDVKSPTLKIDEGDAPN
jgi:hypothetical protein